MSDNPMDRLPSYNRVSVRAVMVGDEEDLHAALAEAGIHNPVAVTVMLGETLDLSTGILGDGVTPNLMAVLETEHPDASEPAAKAQQTARPQPQATQPTQPGTTTLPAAYGIQPLAPVKSRR